MKIKAIGRVFVCPTTGKREGVFNSSPEIIDGSVIYAESPVEPKSDAQYPECSGDSASCPENEGHGCCKPNPSMADEIASAKQNLQNMPESMKACAHFSTTSASHKNSGASLSIPKTEAWLIERYDRNDSLHRSVVLASMLDNVCLDESSEAIALCRVEDVIGNAVTKKSDDPIRKGFWDVYYPNNLKRIYVTVFNSAEASSYAENGYVVIEQASGKDQQSLAASSEPITTASVNFDQSDFSASSILWNLIDTWFHADPDEEAGTMAASIDSHIKWLITKYVGLSSNQPVQEEHHVFIQPGWNHVSDAFINGAKEQAENPTAVMADWVRAADGYTKRVHEQVDPETERRIRENDWPEVQPVQAKALTDEEVTKIAEKFEKWNHDGSECVFDKVGFARALIASQPSKSEREPFFYINTDDAQEFIEGKRNSFYVSKEKKFPFNMAMFSNTPSAKAERADVAAVRDGWKLVPIEPTVTMLRVGEKWHETWMPNAVASVSNIYNAMLSAAPTAQPQADGDK